LAALPPGKTRYPLCSWLSGPQDRSGRVQKILPPPGFDPWTVQPVASRWVSNKKTTTVDSFFKDSIYTYICNKSTKLQSHIQNCKMFQSRLRQSKETTPGHFRYLRKKGVAQSYSNPGTLRAIVMTRHILNGWCKTPLILCELHHHQEGICLCPMHLFSPPCHSSRHNTSHNLHVTQLVVSQ
jgi:hypothetical protein